LIMMQRYVFVRVEMAAGLRWGALALLVGTGLAAYAVAGQLLGAFDVRMLLDVLRRRRRKLA